MYIIGSCVKNANFEINCHKTDGGLHEKYALHRKLVVRERLNLVKK